MLGVLEYVDEAVRRTVCIRLPKLKCSYIMG
jgi:hypothetical protein